MKGQKDQLVEKLPVVLLDMRPPSLNESEAEIGLG